MSLLTTLQMTVFEPIFMPWQMNAPLAAQVVRVTLVARMAPAEFK